jgi:sterol desaturase/sphingolipid hydroxylase (fatty acid hydroxylase superfamily)
VELFLITTAYFSFLYFVLGPIFLAICKALASRNVLQKISTGPVTTEQTRFEIKHSFSAVTIFGFSSWPVIYLIRNNIITLLPDTLFNVITGLVILTAWNEVHFFIVHRIMHLPTFMRRVHAIHHRSVTPTVYSVYSFHWFEALLLSTPPLIIALFVSFSPLAIGLFPLVSILINYCGHCNYRFGKGNGPSWATFGTRHAEHHYKQGRNYGFATNILDKLISLFQRKNIND